MLRKLISMQFLPIENTILSLSIAIDTESKSHLSCRLELKFDYLRSQKSKESEHLLLKTNFNQWTIF